MITINLLPWRQERLKRVKEHYIRLVIVFAVFVLLLVFLAHMVLSDKVSSQQSRNAMLKGEIVKLDKQLHEIKTLEEEKQNLIERMEIVTKLESTRNDAVNLLSELAASLPNGVALTRVVQSGSNITLSGLAQSNARVSEFMRELDQSEHFANPRLSRIDGEKIRGYNGSKFSLKVDQKFKRDEKQ